MMGLFKKKVKSDENEIRAYEPKNTDNRFEEYIDQANALPLLTDEEINRFALTGEQPVISDGSLGTSWSSYVNTQFLIRLRRTLLSRISDDSTDEVVNEG